ncbi:flavin reductase family protein [Streptomyces indicus]|uniref:NADH-FMN oxidoreductase RutF, flavin reductase (DIM6/NTAB) family n=1 Tax=Streptomyces indicus TaxID=417292 RepID=A0A1G9HNV1_9ACTN|nr:flavin reductase family protein [Streptomyces indicus]SDL14476.1 NADH-FMN oxidoreductase RutF, flavin reductase (DIM6/NTAB) family [Streptomyces indicus]
MPSSLSTDISQEEFRATLGRFTTGVVAVTALRERDSVPVGLAVNSFTSVSLAPALVLFCVSKGSTSWPQIRTADHFCINILGEHQQDLSSRLATRDTDKFRGVRWTATPGGAPVLDGAIGWLECSVETEYEAGDHDVIISRVHVLSSRDDGAPLVFYRGSYGRLAA